MPDSADYERGDVEVKLLLSRQIAERFRRPEGFTHFGTVTMKLTGDPEVLSIWFSETGDT